MKHDSYLGNQLLKRLLGAGICAPPAVDMASIRFALIAVSAQRHCINLILMRGKQQFVSKHAQLARGTRLRCCIDRAAELRQNEAKQRPSIKIPEPQGPQGVKNRCQPRKHSHKHHSCTKTKKNYTKSIQNPSKLHPKSSRIHPKISQIP